MCPNEIAHGWLSRDRGRRRSGSPPFSWLKRLKMGQEIGLDAPSGIGHTDSPSPLGRVHGHGNASLFGVNLMAFVSRFATTCWSRAGSPDTGGSDSSSWS